MVAQRDPPQLSNLPGEIRNEIYKIVADYQIQRTDSRACLSIYTDPEWDWKKDKRLTQSGDPHLMILQPGLFLTCKQIRTEGLPFFFRRRDFYLPLDHGKHIFDFYWDQAGFALWFRTIGDLGQQNIRSLTLRNTRMIKGASFLERIHRKLSDQATVVYEADTYGNGRFFAQSLWNIGARFQARNDRKVPIFCVEGDPPTSKIAGPYICRSGICTMEFPPGNGWFGMAQNARAQLWWRRDMRIDYWNQIWLAEDKQKNSQNDDSDEERHE